MRTLWHQIFSQCYSASLCKPVLKNACLNTVAIRYTKLWSAEATLTVIRTLTGKHYYEQLPLNSTTEKRSSLNMYPALTT